MRIRVSKNTAASAVHGRRRAGGSNPRTAPPAYPRGGALSEARGMRMPPGSAVINGDHGEQGGTASQGADDLNLAAEYLDAVPETDQSGPLARIGSSDPVVADCDPQDRILLREVD